MPEKQHRPQDHRLTGGVGAVYRRVNLPCQMRNGRKFRFFVSSFAWLPSCAMQRTNSGASALWWRKNRRQGLPTGGEAPGGAFAANGFEVLPGTGVGGTTRASLRWGGQLDPVPTALPVCKGGDGGAMPGGAATAGPRATGETAVPRFAAGQLLPLGRTVAVLGDASFRISERASRVAP